jgi:4-amino-4-deoxy-L-arabinose transferase-like glycosyltransferase
MSCRGDWESWKTRLGLAAVIACAAALAVRWVFLVPIFQAPDEPVHFDYALCIHENGGLLRAPPGSFSAGTLHPYTRHLSECVSLDTIAFTRTRLPPDYGTPEYYGAIDRSAPSRHECRLSHGPPLSQVYPFGYYALLALWLEGVRYLYGDGPVGLLFGARLFSVFLLIISLALTYGIARKLGARSSAALFLTGCIGCFPLVSFVGSYVQPDNLAFTLVSLCFFLALCLSRRPASLKIQCALGLALGLLLVTKIHFYLCVLLPIVGNLVSRRPACRSLRGTFCGMALLVFPSLVLGQIHYELTRGSESYYAVMPPYTGFYEFWVLGFRKAFQSFYLGLSHQSFWGIFGWLDAPLHSGSQRVDQISRLIFRGTTLLCLGLVLVRVGQVVGRLIRVARKGRTRRAVQILFTNVPLNSFFAFTALMFALYIRTDNRFAAQGRNWLPFMLPIFWTGLAYAPRVFRWTALRSVIRVGAGVTLALAATVGSAWALKTVAQRYYYSPEDLQSFRQYLAVVRCYPGEGLAAAVFQEPARCLVHFPKKYPLAHTPLGHPRCPCPLRRPQRFTFRCPVDRLTGIEVLLAAPGRPREGSVTVVLQGEDGHELVTSTVDARCLVDGAFQWFPFKGVRGLRGRTLGLQLSAVSSEGPVSVSAWTAKGKPNEPVAWLIAE